MRSTAGAQLEPARAADQQRKHDQLADGRSFRPEHISGALRAWAEREAIRIERIQPGQPQQNAYIERYNRTVRYGWLARTLFDTVEQGQGQSHALAMDLQP